MHACPKCGKPESAWEESFCGSCEEAYRRAQQEWQESSKKTAEEDAAKKNADFMTKSGADYGPYYAKSDELGDWYVAWAEI